MEELISRINQIYTISDETLLSLKSCLKEEVIKKYHLVLQEGQICNRLWFIKKGFIRVYHLNDGIDNTTWFLRENDFVFSVYSFLGQKPSYEFIETLEESTLISISFPALQNIYELHKEFNIIGRSLTEHYYVLSELRTLLLRTSPVENRLRNLLNHIPDIFNRTSSKQIASYIGCQPETLSRIRKHI